ncbi:MAG: carboxypeptidase-like regulatory domain-containing protein, partial [Planctomycetota bacterium]|nr:carboxypeptidase-like regulatory domain-containing protein [Planctomycetota bacterium]
MSSRIALPLIALLLLAIASWVILDSGSSSPDSNNRSQGQGDQTELEETPPLAGGGLSSSNNSADQLERTDIDLVDSGDDHNLDLSNLDFIPSFTGRVVDEEGNPVEGVEVFAMAMLDWARGWDPSRNVLPADWAGTTDANGYFALPEPPRERLHFMLEFSHPELATFELFNQPSTPGRTRDLGVLTMDIGFSLSGVVLDPHGGAVAGAQVTPFRGGGPEGFNPADKNKRALLKPIRTDERGRFHLVRLPTQPVRLLATAPTYFEAWSQIAYGESGKELEDMEIRLVMATSASGYVMDNARNPIAGARIEVRDSRWEDGVEAAPFLTETESDQDGRFSLLIPDSASRTNLTAGADGFYVIYKRLDDMATSAPIEVMLAPIKPVTGVVVDEAGSAVPGATIALLQSSNRLTDPRNATPNASGISDEDGAFELIPNLKTAWGGRFKVYAWDEEHAIGESQLLRIRESKNAMPELRVILKRGFRAAGVVVKASGEPHPSAKVQLRKLKMPRRNSRMPELNESERGGDIVERAIADADGAFEFTNLPTGDYRLETYAKGYSPAQSDD